MRRERAVSISKRKTRRGLWITLGVLGAALIALLIALALYLGHYYHADLAAIENALPEGTTFREEPDGSIVFEPEGATVGLIFYPGGKVEHRAYIPLMAALAEEGILCILVEMPFRLAVLDVNAADGLQSEYRQIERWYIGGHSLGGSMAASYLSKHEEDFEGLVLLGSYSTADLSESGLAVLSVYGSEDGVLNREKYRSSLDNLPPNFTESVIDGGCHAGFGMYGPQKGDGTPRISAVEQIGESARRIVAWIGQ